MDKHINRNNTPVILMPDNKHPISLQEAITKLVEKHGESIIQDSGIVDLLAENPKIRKNEKSSLKLLEKLIDDGFADMIIEADELDEEFFMSATLYSVREGLNSAEVTHLIFCLAESIGQTITDFDNDEKTSIKPNMNMENELEEQLTNIVERKKNIEEAFKLSIDNIYISTENNIDEDGDEDGFIKIKVNFEINLMQNVRKLKDDVTIKIALYDQKGRVCHTEEVDYIYASDFKGFATYCHELDMMYIDPLSALSKIIIYLS